MNDRDMTPYVVSTRLLEALFVQDGPAVFDDLGALQACYSVPTLYFSGSRVDHKYCIRSSNVAIVHCRIPECLIRTIVPAYHTQHEEIVMPTHGVVAVEYSTCLDARAEVREVLLRPGEHLLLMRGWPHRISAAPWRESTNPNADGVPVAGYLAIKCGLLSGKNSDEDMGTWEDRPHPLIERCKLDQLWLEQRDGSCKSSR